MRILQLINRRYRRGAEVFATLLSDALAERGHDVELVGLYAPPEDELVPNVARFTDLGTASRLKLNPALVWRVARYVEAARPDLVQANGSDTLKYATLAKRISGGDWPIVYRNISVASQWLRWPGHRLWGRFLSGGLDHVVSVAEESRDDFVATYGVPPQHASTIRRGIDVTPFPRDEARAALAALGEARPEAPLLVHIGSFTPEKNHAWMIEAFADVYRRRSDVHLFLFGDGALRPGVERQIGRLGLGGSVHVLGSRDDATKLVAGADLLLLPSLIEGIPGVVLEAAAQGVPAVATDVGGIGEAVESGERGVLVPLGDRAAFVGAILRLLDDDGLRQRMGEAARRFVCEHYDIDKTASAFERLYLDILDRRRHPAPQRRD